MAGHERRVCETLAALAAINRGGLLIYSASVKTQNNAVASHGVLEFGEISGLDVDHPSSCLTTRLGPLAWNKAKHHLIPVLIASLDNTTPQIRARLSFQRFELHHRAYGSLALVISTRFIASAIPSYQVSLSSGQLC